MTGVFLHSYLSTKYVDDAALPKIDHPLGRRMTPLQRSVLATCRAIFEKSNVSLREFADDKSNVVFMTSAFGEISSNFSVIRDVAEERFPVSPTDFQHSIYNATLGYWAIVDNIDLSYVPE